MDAVRAGIGRQINLAFRVAFILVLLVGGVSVLLARTISVGVEKARQHSLEVQAIDRIHSTVQHFVSDLHLVLQAGRLQAHQSPEVVLAELKTQIAAYEALERAQGGDEAAQELARLGRFTSLLSELERRSAAAIDASSRVRPLPQAQVAALNELAHEVSEVVEGLHTLHAKKFQRATDASQRQMLLISTLYVAFVFAGGLGLLVGDRFLFRHLVAPITRLAEAAFHIAGGDLSRRVHAQAGGEIGQLAQAFNVMTERLEAHEAERLTSEAELERQVKERTRELEETTARLRSTQAQLIRSERIAVTGQIAAGVTHEIRTPLNSLAINVQLLRRELSAEAALPSLRDLVGALATLEYEITRINRILEEFVNFARLPRPRLEHVELEPLVQEVLALLAPQAAAAGVSVDSRAATASAVTADPDQLRQVFLNLAHNALQAMPAGGRLGMEIGQDGDRVEITVRDSGPGVPEVEQEAIFHPFVSTRPDGLGLGLPIVRRIVEEHGGTVNCCNRPEGGAAFTVRLPAAVRDDER